ncbi:mannosyltransferase family protein [Archangium sp.]|uniref:mannosyltransferase family protein n=1 Tax=Archangium sp. TaxID=1872627 RepID=UPI002EDBA140
MKTGGDWSSLRSAGWAFLVSRALVLALVLVGPVPSNRPPWPGLRNEGLAPGAGPALSELAVRGDGEWYVGIAEKGYEAVPFDVARQHNWAFFPLMPLLMRAAGQVTGEVRVTGMVLSTVLLLLGLVLLHELALALGLEEAAARRAVLYTALWPTSIFFSLPTTESLFLLLCVVSFWGAATGRMWLAGLAGALASATRPNGLLLLPALALLYLERKPGRPRRDALWLLLVPVGLLAFAAFLHALTGNALAFSDIQVRWGRAPGFFLSPLWSYLRRPWEVAVPWNFKLLNFAASLVGFWAVGFWARRRRWALSAYVLVGLLVPLSTQSVQSLARFVMIAFPVCLALGLVGKRERVHEGLMVVLTALFVIVTLGLVAGYTFALT